MDFFTRILVLDGTGENISKDVRDVCDSFHVVIEYSSAGAPQENARAEKGVQDIGRITRALFVGAPHASCASKFLGSCTAVRMHYTFCAAEPRKQWPIALPDGTQEGAADIENVLSSLVSPGRVHAGGG
jgi:hypothetical protein